MKQSRLHNRDAYKTPTSFLKLERNKFMNLWLALNYGHFCSFFFKQFSFWLPNWSVTRAHHAKNWPHRDTASLILRRWHSLAAFQTVWGSGLERPGGRARRVGVCLRALPSADRGESVLASLRAATPLLSFYGVTTADDVKSEVCALENEHQWMKKALWKSLIARRNGAGYVTRFHV